MEVLIKVFKTIIIHGSMFSNEKHASLLLKSLNYPKIIVALVFKTIFIHSCGNTLAYQSKE
jgi:hypothetical protein